MPHFCVARCHIVSLYYVFVESATLLCRYRLSINRFCLNFHQIGFKSLVAWFCSRMFYIVLYYSDYIIFLVLFIHDFSCWKHDWWCGYWASIVRKEKTSNFLNSSAEADPFPQSEHVDVSLLRHHLHSPR